MNEDLTRLEGIFIKKIYSTDSYMVCIFHTEDGSINVTGPYFEFQSKERYILTGEYVDHPRYGFQFNYVGVEKYLPTRKSEIISFLKGKAFPGIGKKAAEAVYECFGDDTLLILKEEPEKAREVRLSAKQQESLVEGFSALSDPQNNIIFYLVSNGFNNNEAQKIFSTFDLDTFDVVADNPFRIYNEIYGMSFDKVRRFASNVDFEDKENKYLEAYVIFLISEYTFSSGDIYIDIETLERIVEKNGGNVDLESIIEKGVDHHYLIRKDERIYLYSDYYDEEYIAHYLNQFDYIVNNDQDQIDECIRNIEEKLSIRYDQQQLEAINNFFSNDFSIIVGGPGTGKTTIVKAMVEMFRELFPFNNLIVAAPTGRAAKRINEICDVDSKTIHSLLRWNLETNTFVHDIDNPILYDAIIIDEFSMVDNNLFASLLKASSKVKKICIIGDSDQLPSIRPGDLLSDLIESGCFPVTRLLSNYRQSQGSEIIDLANDIKNGEIDLSKYDRDISFYDIRQQDIDIVSLIRKDLQNGFLIDEIQVLTPMHKGVWGIENLNILLQNAFNPPSAGKKEKRIGRYVFREGDKILQLKNRPNDDVYNGDIGILIEINDTENYLLVDYSGIDVFYEFDDLNDISLAYAMSVHKAQGSEYQAVYFVISKANVYMLNKKLIYTAISRGKQKLAIIGEEMLLKQGISHMLRKRKTSLLERIII